MVSAVEEPSQAERLEAVADATVAGPGATDSAVIGNLPTEKPANGSSSSSSEVAMEPNAAEKTVATPQAPQRSAGKVALIMGSLCVSGVGLVNGTGK